MATLDQLRSLFPNAGSDSDVIKSAAKEFGLDPKTIAADIGFDINKAGFVSDVKRGTGQVISGFGSTARDLGLPMVGKAVEGYGEDIQFRNPSQISTVGEAVRSPLTTVREALGEVVPQIGASTAFGLAGRALGALTPIPGGSAIGGAAGAYVGNLIQEYGGIRSEQREQGIEDKGRAFATGAAAAGLDTAFGAERVVNKFLTKGSDILAREAGTSLAKQVGKQTAIGFGTEALTETGQTALERLGAFKELTGDEALNEYGLSAIKGGIGGGVIRGGLSSIAGERTPTGGNDIQQAFSQPDVSGTPINNIAPPVAPLVATPAQTAAPSSVETSVPVPPAVTGGTTDIAQAQQQTQADIQAAQIEEQQIQQAQALQAQRDEIGTYFGAEPAIENGRLVGGTIFGKSFADPEKFNAELDKLIKNEEPKTPVRRAVEKAFMDSLPPEKRKLNTIQSGALQFWANKPDIAAAAESINTAMSDLVAKGKGIDDPKVTQFAQMYEALTGSEAPAYEAATKVKPKGAKDGQLPLQTTTGLGAVPVEGGTTEADAAGAGSVGPSDVQPVGAGSVPEGSLGLQVGQPSGEGIRTGTGTESSVGNGNAPSQVIGAPNEQAVQSVDGGGQAGQPAQADQANVDQQLVQTGARPYDPRISFYSTDLSHISSERRIEIISDLLLRVLAPKQERKNTVPAATRAEILRLALLEQFRHADIAEYTGLKTDTVEKQLERMGVKLVDGEFQVVDPEFAVRVVETAAAYRSPEFPDGIGQGELSGLYNTRYEGDEETATTLAEEIQAGEQEGKAGAKLQEELRGKEDGEGKSMGTVATAGGSQGAVDSAGTAFFDKVEKLQAKLEAMPPQDPRRKAAAEQIQKLWADYAKGQEKRRAKGEADVTEEGDEDAVQESSAEEVPVREGTTGGKAVGKGNAKRGKAAAKAEVKPKQEAKPEEVKTPTEEWAVVSTLAPELPPYDALTNSEKSRWDDLVRRGQANLAAAVKIVGEVTQPAGTALANKKAPTTGTDGVTKALTNEPVTIDVEARVIDESVTTQIAALPAPQVDRLETHYGVKRGTAEFLEKVQADITKYVTQGAEAVAGAIRSIIKTMAEGVLAVGIVFNPNITKEAFTINVAKTFQQTIEITQPVPEAAKAQMSPTAQAVYSAMAPVAMKSGKWFMVADKPNGMLHIFKEDGSHALSDPTLYGKDKGDVLGAVSSLEGGPKITPAGKFTMKESPADYAGGTSLILMESKDYTGYIAVHAADTSTPSENRLGRLASATTDDNRISYGCINTKHDTFINKIKPNITKLDGGMMFILPESEDQAAKLFAAETRTETRTEGGQGAKGRAAATLVAKEETMPTMADVTRFSKTSNTPAGKNSVIDIWNTLSKVFDVALADSFYKDFVRVSQTAEQAFQAAGKKIPLAQLQNAQAFIDPTDDRVVHLIADNIVKGSEFAVLLHEVGVHVGLKKKLGANFKILEGQVKAWANSPKDSLEYKVYERAMARVAAGRLEGSITSDIAAEELVAYAAEEAALVGVKVKDAPRSKLEMWVKQLHDIAAKAFKTFFGASKVPELSVQDLVNFSFAAAQEQMQAYRSEIGATAEATDSQVVKYYVGSKGTYAGATLGTEGPYGLGLEPLSWNPDDKFGPHTGIQTKAFYQRAQPRTPEYMAMVLTSDESRAFGEQENNSQDKVLLTIQAYRDPALNVWSLSVHAPDTDSALYTELYVNGLATTTTDNEGNEWSRLEGISGRDNLRLLGEFRRRLTRLKNGEIPNIDFTRVTGSGASITDGNYKRYSADELATRFSKTPTADRVISAMPKPLQKSAREQWTNIKTLAKRGLYASAITEDVISLAKKYMPSAAKYLQAQYARQGTRLEFEKRIEDILGAFDRLPENLKGTGKGSVNEYIHDSTREKKWGYYPGEQQIGTTLFEVDPDLEKRFKAFPPAAQRVIKDVFRHGYEALKLKQKAAENAVNREFESREKAAGNDADLLQSIAKEKKQMLKRITSLRNVDVSNPYAYLGRYGDYVVIAKSKEFIAYEEAATGTRSSARGDSIIGDPQQAKNWLQDNVSNPLHYVVQFAETQGEADSIAEELQATGQYDIQPEDAGIKEVNSSYMGGSDVHMAVARLRNLANRQTESTDAKLDKAISDLYLMTVAEASARRSELERKNVSGADKNMMRNLATSGRADAHFLATMEHSDELNDALEAMRDQARNNRKDAMPLYNELYTRYADSMEYSQPSVLAQNLLRMSTLWNLSTSPAYYLQQVLQTSVLSLPYMAGRLGYFRSARAIKRAYGDMSALVQGLGINDHINFDKAPADVRFMLKELVRMGKIDIGIDADAKARTDDQGPLGKVMFKLQGINTRIEAINRATAAIAAYRGYVDRYKGATGADGVRFAAEVVSNTHGNYDGFNTPRVMQSGGAKVLLQFKRFQIIQLSMLAKLIHTSFKGANAEERAIARASLKYITAHMAVLGGALGVPFVSQAASILSSVFGDDEEPDDYEYKLRRMIGNDAVADLLLRGVPAAVGLESIGKRLSMENVASPFGPFVEFNITSRADAAQMIVGMMGPTVGLGLKFADALGMMSKGDYYKGLELALPNGVANVMKGYRFANEGITMRNGDLVMKPEDISMIDAAFQAVGLPTTTITDRQYTQKVVAEFDKFYASRAGEIKGAYVEASRQSDAAAMAEARDDWQKLQESRVRNGYKRQPMSELFRAPVEARKRERGVVGGVETTKSNRRFVEQQVNQ